MRILKEIFPVSITYRSPSSVKVKSLQISSQITPGLTFPENSFAGVAVTLTISGVFTCTRIISCSEYSRMPSPVRSVLVIFLLFGGIAVSIIILLFVFLGTVLKNTFLCF